MFNDLERHVGSAADLHSPARFPVNTSPPLPIHMLHECSRLERVRRILAQTTPLGRHLNMVRFLHEDSAAALTGPRRGLAGCAGCSAGLDFRVHRIAGVTADRLIIE
jgi:hypothetical protein